MLPDYRHGGIIKIDVSSESSARQRIHMKNQALFYSKDKSKKLKCRLLQFLFGALRVKVGITVTNFTTGTMIDSGLLKTRKVTVKMLLLQL